MDELTIKTLNPICRLFFKIYLLTDFFCDIVFNRFYRLEIHSLNGWYFRPSLWTVAPMDVGTILVYCCPSILCRSFALCFWPGSEPTKVLHHPKLNRPVKTTLGIGVFKVPSSMGIKNSATAFLAASLVRMLDHSRKYIFFSCIFIRKLFKWTVAKDRSMTCEHGNNVLLYLKPNYIIVDNKLFISKHQYCIWFRGPEVAISAWKTPSESQQFYTPSI